MYIELTKGYRAIVNDDDYERLNKYKWAASSHWPPRAVRGTTKGGKSQTISMAHEVLNLVPWPFGNSMVVDHIDRNPLNNQRENLRLVSKSPNALNSARSDDYKGICYHKQSGRWIAYLKGKYLGIRKTKEEAQKLLGEARK